MLTKSPAKRKSPWSLRLSFAVLVGLAAAVVPAVGAQAEGTIQVSDDGITFGTVYPGVLFDGISAIAPGDARVETFHLRNSGPDAGYVRLVLYGTNGDPAFTDALTIRASVPAQPGSDVVVSWAAPCWVLNEGIFLGSGESVSVTTSLLFMAAAGNTAQSSVAQFGMGVSLTDTAVILPPTECGGPGTRIVIVPPDLDPEPEGEPETGATSGSGALTTSGSDLPIMLIIGSAFAMGIGLFFIVVAWRRRREEDAESFGP